MNRALLPMMWAFAVAIAPSLLMSCTITRSETMFDLVHITAKSIETVDVSNGADELVATFEITNRSNRPVCLNEDVLVNKLSPYITITYNDKEHPAGLPHRPITSEIAQINAADHREFKRIIGYATSPKATARVYVISVKLWDCETSEAFVRRAKILG